jgi:hypothetical protein
LAATQPINVDLSNRFSRQRREVHRYPWHPLEDGSLITLIRLTDSAA